LTVILLVVVIIVSQSDKDVFVSWKAFCTVCLCRCSANLFAYSCWRLQIWHHH